MLRRMLLFTTLVAVTAGCGSRAYKTADVSGRVSMNGKPLVHVRVRFVPVSAYESQESLPTSGGITDENGHYSLTLDDGSERKGAVVGKHKVLITVTDLDDPKDGKPHYHKELPGKYNRTSELTQDVPEGGTEKADFALTSR